MTIASNLDMAADLQAFLADRGVLTQQPGQTEAAWREAWNESVAAWLAINYSPEDSMKEHAV